MMQNKQTDIPWRDIKAILRQSNKINYTTVVCNSQIQTVNSVNNVY